MVAIQRFDSAALEFLLKCLLMFSQSRRLRCLAASNIRRRDQNRFPCRTLLQPEPGVEKRGLVCIRNRILQRRQVVQNLLQCTTVVLVESIWHRELNHLARLPRFERQVESAHLTGICPVWEQLIERAPAVGQQYGLKLHRERPLLVWRGRSHRNVVRHHLVDDALDALIVPRARRMDSLGDGRAKAQILDEWIGWKFDADLQLDPAGLFSSVCEYKGRTTKSRGPERTHHRSELSGLQELAAASFPCAQTKHLHAKPDLDWNTKRLRAAKRAAGVGHRRTISVQIPYGNCASHPPTRKHLNLLLILARPAGIEPATPAFGGQYSIH